MGEKIGETIKRLRKEKGMTLEELGNKVGVGKSTVRKWENGIIANMKRDKIEKLADALNVPVYELMGWKEPSKEEIIMKINASLKKIKVARVPILSEVPCGNPSIVYENIDPDDFVEIDSTLADTREYYGLRAKGNSMLPRIEEGDTLIVHFQRNIESGQVAIVKVDGEEATCKKVKKFPNGIMLMGFNPEFEPRFFTDDEIQSMPVEIIGRVVEVRTRL